MAVRVNSLQACAQLIASMCMQYMYNISSLPAQYTHLLTFPSSVLSTMISLNSPGHDDVLTSSKNACREKTATSKYIFEEKCNT